MSTPEELAAKRYPEPKSIHHDKYGSVAAASARQRERAAYSAGYTDAKAQALIEVIEWLRSQATEPERAQALSAPAPERETLPQWKLYDRALRPDGYRGQIRQISGTSAYVLPDRGTIGQWFYFSELKEALPLTRDDLGRMVREAWIIWAKTQANPKPSWLVPYDELAECDKEADRQIGDYLSRALSAPAPATGEGG